MSGMYSIYKTDEVITDVEKKMQALSLPRGFSIRPILIHVNGVSDQVLAKEFFSRIFDFSQLLEDNRH